MARLLPLLAGLALAACATAPRPDRPGATPPPVLPGFEKQPGEVSTAHDLTRDGKPDVWTYVLRDANGKEALLRKEMDLNADGKVDSWERYGADGAIARLAHDLDFDGKPDVTLVYEKGQLVRKDLAFGFDGVPSTWSHYEKGRLVRKERDTNADGKVDSWEYWEQGEIDRIGVDEDGDGRIDRWESRRSAAPGGDQK